jgi:hypothetical protein
VVNLQGQALPLSEVGVMLRATEGRLNEAAGAADAACVILPALWVAKAF